MTLHQKPDPLRREAGARTKIVAVGNSLGIILSKEMLARLKVERGDQIYLVETGDGLVITPYDPAVTHQVEAGKRFMNRYRDTFRALAK